MGQYPTCIHSVISNNPKDLNQFLETLGSRLEEIDLELVVATRVQVCLDEMLSNAIKYGYPPEKTGQIEVSITYETDEIVVSVTDDGVTFDPFTRDDLDSLDLDIEDREIGGLGIHIVKNMASRVDHQRQNNRNINRFWIPLS